MNSTDLELLAGIARRDRSAFSALYDRFAGRAFGIILNVLRNRDDAEDVFQETFLQVWNQANRFDPTRSTPEGWLVMIARSRAVDKLRKKNLATIDVIVSNPASPPVGEEISIRDEMGRACIALNRLETEQREPIRLAFFGGLTHTEIAKELKLPLGTVKTRIRQGMIRLRDDLKDARETQ